MRDGTGCDEWLSLLITMDIFRFKALLGKGCRWHCSSQDCSVHQEQKDSMQCVAVRIRSETQDYEFNKK